MVYIDQAKNSYLVNPSIRYITEKGWYTLCVNILIRQSVRREVVLDNIGPGNIKDVLTGKKKQNKSFQVAELIINLSLV